MQIPSLSQQQVAEEALQIDGGIVYAFLRVLVVGADKGIAEVPGMPGEQVVVCIESYGAQVLYDYITLNVPSGAFSNVPLQTWSLSVAKLRLFLIFSSHRVTF